MSILYHPRRLIKQMAHRMAMHGYEWYVPSGTGWSIGGHEAYLNSEIMQPGHRFIDVGAHIGRWAIPASKYYGEVLAFEPTPLTNRILRVNIALNKLQNVKVYQNAVSDNDDWADFWLYDDKGGANSILKAHLGQYGTRKIGVRCTMLDNYPRADTIKIDVEGWEYHVLRGAEKQLSKKPKLLIELHNEANLPLVRGILDRYSYTRVRNYPIPGYPNIVTLVAE